MNDPQRAVFLSYASQDAEAAGRVSEALRAAGIEVWFDRSELRGGDIWDQKIRREIRDCALFIPIVSVNTQERTEGYFRLEWRLADQRTHLMGKNRAFLLPVCIDDTRGPDADVPDSFQAAQWTLLPGGETPSAFVDRVSRLLAQDDRDTKKSTSQARIQDPALQRFQATTRFRRVSFLTAAAVTIAICFFAADRSMFSRHGSEHTVNPASTTPSGSAAANSIPAASIAVLPFVDMSENKDQEYFSDGLAEEVLNRLAKIPGTHVIARTSSFSFKGKADDIPTIARKLNVANILEGSVRKSGNRLRIATQLVRADSGENLWSETYDRELKDVFQVQDEIAGAVVSALKVKLAPAMPASQVYRTSSTEAYNQYLIGQRFLDSWKIEDYRRASDAYRRAIELDPSYGAAYAGLARAVRRISGSDGGTNKNQYFAFADKAIELAPDEANGYAIRGALRMIDRWDWDGARTDLEKAVALDPGDGESRRLYAQLLARLGHLQEAIAVTRKATELDPLSSNAWFNLGTFLTADRQWGAARASLNRALEIQPDSVGALYASGRLLLLQGKAADALSSFRTIGAEVPRLLGITMAEFSLDHPNESQHALDDLIAHAAQHAAFQIAEAFAWRRDKTRAFEWLERAYQQHDDGLSGIKIDPLLAALHGDGRFEKLLLTMRLAP